MEMKGSTRKINPKIIINGIGTNTEVQIWIYKFTNTNLVRADLISMKVFKTVNVMIRKEEIDPRKKEIDSRKVEISTKEKVIGDTGKINAKIREMRNRSVEPMKVGNVPDMGAREITEDARVMSWSD